MTTNSSATVHDRFVDDGFAVIERIAGPECIAELGEVFDAMIDGRIPCPGTDRELGGITRQIMLPHQHHPSFASNEAIDNATELARGLLHTDEPFFSYSMLIHKPAGHPHPTPWHQDVAYAGAPATPPGVRVPNDSAVQFWVALDDVDETMGCMEFVPGAQHDPLPEHVVASGDPHDEGRLLATKDPATAYDLGSIVTCPLRAGSATVHGYATPHYTGPNRSRTKDRRAFIFTLNNPDTFRLPDEVLASRRDWGRPGEAD